VRSPVAPRQVRLAVFDPSGSRVWDLASLVGYALAASVFFWPMVVAGRAPYWGDLLLYFYPIAHLAIGTAGSPLVFWNPYIFGGTPLAANPQTFTFYPFRILFYLLPLDRAMTYLLVGHVVAAGAAMYLWLRRRLLGPLPAFLGGLVFMFSSYVVTHFFEVTMTLAVAWVPLALLGVDGLIRTGRLSRAVWAGLALGMPILAGHMQTWYIATLLCGVYGLGMVLVEPHSRTPRALVGTGGLLVLMLLVSVGVGSVQLLPMLDLVARMFRPQDSFAFATQFSLTPRQLIRLVVPDFFGAPQGNDYWGEWNYWELGSYVGIAPLVLTVVALAFSARRERLVLGAISLLSLALALGAFSPFYRLAYIILPGLAAFRVPARFLLWFTVAAAALSAIGVEALAQGVSRARLLRWLALLAVSFLITLAGLWVAAERLRAAPTGTTSAWLFRPYQWSQYFPRHETLQILHHMAERAQESIRLAAIWSVASFAAVASYGLARRFPVLVSLGVLAIVAADLFVAGISYNLTTDPEVIRHPPSAGNWLQDTAGYRIYHGSRYLERVVRRYASFSGFGSAEPAFLEGLSTSLIPNANIMVRVASVGGYDPLMTRDYVLVLRIVQTQLERTGRSPMLDFLGARYLIVDHPLRDPSYRLSRKGESQWIYENPGAFPKLIAVSSYRVIERREALRQLASGEADLRRVALLEEEPFPDRAPPQGPLSDKIEMMQYTADRIQATVELNRPAVVVMNDTWFPGWTASIDGHPAKILRTNLSFRAVAVPAGRHVLVFSYSPRWLRVGIVTTSAMFVLAVWWLGRGMIRRCPYG